YFMKVTDLDLKKYLQMFTLLDLTEIKKIIEKHMEEYPPILSNIGMGSLLLNYYRKIDSNDTYIPA
ncbi:7032_t:CDS:2, partial [Entrophospora sp. SA101]